MAALDSTLRKQLVSAVVNARTIAENAADKALKRLGMHQLEPPSTLSPDERSFRSELEAQKSQLAGYPDLVEQCAYEHWHRILFARFLAENELLIHPNAGVAVSLEDCDDAELQAEFGASDAYDLAARYAAQMLPAVFRPDDALLRVKLAPEDRIALEKLVQELPEAVFKADDSLGWTYQFWQKERKEQVNKAEDAVEGSDISAVTQLFTEHYMVRFLLENTIGAWWFAHNPGSQLKNVSTYFKPDIPHDFSAFPTNLKDVTFIDPCCGSGHFLVEAFLLFQSMYREQGMNAAQAGDAAIENNIRGLELDPRCTQIAAFNIAFAAWRHGGFRKLPEIEVACSGIPLKGNSSTWEKLAGGNPTLVSSMRTLHQWFASAQDLGSLISPPSVVTTPVDKRMEGQVPFEGMVEEMQRTIALEAEARWQQVRELLIAATEEEENREAYFAGVRAQGIAKAAQMLSDRYWFAITNPPFLAVSKAGEDLKDFCNKNHPEAKKDLATCFIERLRAFAKPDAEYALVSPQNWLFLGSDKKFRQKLLKEQRWLAVVRFGEGAFESAAAAGAFTANLIFANRKPTADDSFFGLDASAPKSAQAKASLLRESSADAQKHELASDNFPDHIQAVTMKVLHCSEAEAVEYLTRHNGASVFRGQTERFLRDDGTGLDSMLPSASVQGKMSSNPNGVSHGDAVVAAVAALLCAISVAFQNDRAVMHWVETLPDPPDPTFVAKFCSLGQHVGLPTWFLDVTSSVSVALWFACHEWESSTRLNQGEGVIYRFDRISLEQILTSHEAGKYSGIYDLSDVPIKISARPKNQCGLTACGLEDPDILRELILADAVVAIRIIRDGSLVLPLKSHILAGQQPLEDALRQLCSANLQDWIEAYDGPALKRFQTTRIDLSQLVNQRFVLGRLAV